MKRNMIKKCLLALFFLFVMISGSMGTLENFNTSEGVENPPNTSDTVTSEWQEFVGGSSSEYGNAVWANETSIYTCGRTYSYGEGNGDVYLQKWDTDGNLLWTEVWGGYSYEDACSIVGDGEFVYLCGYTRSYTLHGYNDILIMKWDADGNLIWFRVWGEPNYDYGYSIALDEGYLYITGVLYNNLILLKYDLDGNMIWDQEFGGSSTDVGFGIVVIDSFIYTGGLTASYDIGGNDFLLVKWDQNGNVVWYRTWGGTSSEYGNYNNLWTDGDDIYLAGESYSYGPGGRDQTVVKWDVDGNQLWNLSVGISYSYDYCTIIHGDATGVLFGGHSRYLDGLSYNDVILYKAGFDGTILWNKTWEGASYDYGRGLYSIGSNYYITGHTQSYGSGGDDLFLLKWNVELGPTINLESPTYPYQIGGTEVDIYIYDPILDTVLYNWDGTTNQSWIDPYSTQIPITEGTHTLNVYANTTDGKFACRNFEFYVDNTPPTIELEHTINNSYQFADSDIDINVFDEHLENVKFKWDLGTSFNLESPYLIDFPYEEGTHILNVTAEDRSGNICSYNYTLHALGAVEDVYEGRELFALCVGVSNYPGSYNDLRYCDDDARDIRTWLHSRYNVPYENIYILTDYAATTININNTLQTIAAQMDDNDYFFYSFSGHGNFEAEMDLEVPWLVDSPHNYPNYYDHYWHYSYPGAEYMRVHFTKVDTEYGYDGVFVGDYHDTDAAFDLFTGYYTDVWSAWVPTNDIYVELYTDSSVTDWGFQVDKVQIGHQSSAEIIPNDGLTDGITGLELNDMLSIIPGTSISVIDSCFSGGVGNSINSSDRYVVTGGTADEMTLEDSTYTNGVFSYQFIHQWDSATDLNNDGVISFEEAFPSIYSGTVSRSTSIGYTHHPVEFDGIEGDLILDTTAEFTDYAYDIAGNLNFSLMHYGLGYGSLEVTYYDIQNQTYFSPYSEIRLPNSTIQEFQFSPPPGFNTDIIVGHIDAYYEDVHIFDDFILNISGSFFNSSDDTDGDSLNDLFEFQQGIDPWNPDTDNDGMSDVYELTYQLNPSFALDNITDIDFDGLINIYECGNSTDPRDHDSDDDLMNDGWEVIYGLDPLDQSDTYGDPDFDGIVNIYECGNNTNPLSSDTDMDQMPDLWEILNFLDPVNGTDGVIDTDLDNLFNYYEFTNGTDPQDPDTDNDLMWDGWEIDNLLDPLNSSDGILDADFDGLINQNEFLILADPWDNDTDDDLLPDGWEFDNSLNALNASDQMQDPDLDSMFNYHEFTNGTDPQDPDTDNDLMWDGWEFDNLFDPLNSSDGILDADFDGLVNHNEFLILADPWDNDTDDDLLPDGWEFDNSLNALNASDQMFDPDLDTVLNYYEYTNGTDPQDYDTDNDLMWDGWEIEMGFNPLYYNDRLEDPDSDNLVNYREFQYGTDPHDPDTDSDTMDDYYEVYNDLNPCVDDCSGDLDGDQLTNYEEFQIGTRPNDEDTDNDGLDDYQEVEIYGTSPLIRDSDGDSLNDGDEVNTYGSNPMVLDTDGDELGDYEEVMVYHTNPADVDTDHDGINDYREVKMNTNPLSAASSPWIFLSSVVLLGLSFIAIPVSGSIAKKKAGKRRDTKKLKPRPTPSEVKTVRTAARRSNSYYDSSPSKSGLNSDVKRVATALLSGMCPACGGRINKYSLSCSKCYRNYTEFYRKMFGG